MSKPRLAYVDHSFHQKTKSTFFLSELLSEYYEIINVWDESWDGKPGLTALELNSLDAEYIVCFQALPAIAELKQLKAKLIFIPMYDSAIWYADDFWYELVQLPIKILSFSSTLANKLSKIGFDVLSVQYFFNPADLPASTVSGDAKKIFFWQRKGLSFADIKTLIGDQTIDQLILRTDTDPGFKPDLPTPEDIERYHIQTMGWNLSRADYLTVVADCNIYIAPRKYEGIGLTTVEALSMGLAVVAYDHPTMNEYITHQHTGWLFKQPKPIAFQDIQAKGQAARDYCTAGYQRWQSDIPNIFAFFAAPMQPAVSISRVAWYWIKLKSWFQKKLITYRYLHR